MISARSQTAINGCSWVATSATKILNPPREEVQSHEVHGVFQFRNATYNLFTDLK